MHKNMFMFYISVICVTFYVGCAQNDIVTDNGATDANTTFSDITSSTATSTTPAPNISCEAHNNDCKACVQNSKCYFCGENNQCHFHIEKGIVDGKCDISHAYFYTCNVTFKVLLIIIGVLCAIPLLIILIICCYCCCKKKGIKISKDDLKWARQREERKQIAAERRKERAERTDEIRKKYGLVKDSNPYQRFDA